MFERIVASVCLAALGWLDKRITQSKVAVDADADRDRLRLVLGGEHAVDEFLAERFSEVAIDPAHALLPARPVFLHAAQRGAMEREVLVDERLREVVGLPADQGPAQVGRDVGQRLRPDQRQRLPPGQLRLAHRHVPHRATATLATGFDLGTAVRTQRPRALRGRTARHHRPAAKPDRGSGTGCFVIRRRQRHGALQLSVVLQSNHRSGGGD